MNRIFIHFIIFFFISCDLVGQNTSENLNSEKYKLSISRTVESIQLNGKLTELVWQGADVAQNFWQQQPVDDQPASCRTEVRLVYEDHNLYVAAICYDSLPHFIETLKRDNYGDSDEFAIILDPNGQSTNFNPPK